MKIDSSARFILSTIITPLILVMGIIGCQQSQAARIHEPATNDIMVVKLGTGDVQGFNKIREAFINKNPGYDIEYLQEVRSVNQNRMHRVLFIQEGWPDIELSGGEISETTVGDIVLLDPGIGLRADSSLSVLSITSPHPFPDGIPRIIRPDWDPNITDVPGGCATETNAYRRILLTWKKDVGHYLYHALNTHRVRIMDSFSHYHPVDGGFDEFYLVQMALPEARIITSNQVNTITEPHQVTSAQVPELLKTTKLEVGDLVYLPRGVMHRGIGGVLAQVITVPGFIPGAEIGVDHYLKAINENLELAAGQSLPFNLEASNAPVIK